MATVYGTCKLDNGNIIQVVSTSSSGGGRWRRPQTIRVVETTDGKFVTARGRNIIEIHEEYYEDLNSRGEETRGFKRAVRDAVELMKKIVEARRGEKPVEKVIEQKRQVKPNLDARIGRVRLIKGEVPADWFARDVLAARHYVVWSERVYFAPVVRKYAADEGRVRVIVNLIRAHDELMKKLDLDDAEFLAALNHAIRPIGLDELMSLSAEPELTQEQAETRRYLDSQERAMNDIALFYYQSGQTAGKEQTVF
ncbi:hypothetical protein HKD27_04140 [Gluconobacter sp. R75690]|uniref:hypothetical protein n=1 Tax=unclassified Gluconobacter TaxID=2644261 RepID=UPI00188D764D|nr:MULTISPECIES: hypothetical protein [unclassified Gluconobacter]MBF0850113.1 hypothetical protein [Gluconobacter sp. R75690]MBF0879052.1 hypothetical protein [Gluconobacter sp. R75828]